jgi:hypothetical protein
MIEKRMRKKEELNLLTKAKSRKATSSKKRRKRV